MLRLDQPDQCAFCGRLIEPGEPKSGRGDAAAHISCADAALADDRFWDRIATGMGDATPAAPEVGGSDSDGSPPERPAPSGGKVGSGAKSGCLLPGILVALVVLVVGRVEAATATPPSADIPPREPSPEEAGWHRSRREDDRPGARSV